MSAGTQVRTLRIPDALYEEIILTMQRRNVNTREEPWYVTTFIHVAIKEKIAKMARSRKPRRRCATPPQFVPGVLSTH